MTTLLLLLLILLPIATAILILVMRILRRGFTHHWLLAVFCSLSMWIMAWFVRPETPSSLIVTDWQSTALVPMSSALLLDTISWPFLIALTTLTLATLITDIARPVAYRSPGYWIDLVAYLLLTSFSMLATLSGNLLTLVLTWTLLAGLEFVLRLAEKQVSVHSRAFVTALSLRFASISCVIWALIDANATDRPISFTTDALQISTLLLLAAGIHLGILPIHTPIPRDRPKSAGLISLLRLTPCAPSLVLLARTGKIGAPADMEVLFILLAGIAIIYGSLAWIRATSPQIGSPYWIISLASLALAAAVLRQSSAGIAWGVALLCVGGLFTLGTARARGLKIIWIIGLLSISALPFSPTWEGANIYSLPFKPSLVLLLIGQGLFLAGTLRQVFRFPPILIGPERWLGVLYISGLLLLVVSLFTASWFSRAGKEAIGQSQTGWIATGLNMIAVGIAAMAIPLVLSRPWRKTRSLNVLLEILELTWLYRTVSAIFRGVERMVAMVNSILEGRAGILWTLLALALLLSLFASYRPGG